MQDTNHPEATRMPDRNCALIAEALTQMFDFVGGTHQSARIGVRGELAGDFTWINLNLLDGRGFSALTNDWFDMIPSEPSFQSVDNDPANVFDAIMDFLCNKFAATPHFRIQLHLGGDAVLHANSADDTPVLSTAPEFIGC